ncbi:hypothetical protein HYU17_04355 [Candidatus Woesearchaeota archaeon]|nr:hypothetical protein [Candidatus Woesearchaeota archaeon]
MMKSQVFVKIDRYREIYGIVKQLRTKLEDAKQVLKRIKELKDQEDSELASWQNELATVEQKLMTVSEAIAKQ